MLSPMRMSVRRPAWQRPILIGRLLSIAVCTLLPALADAHFVLVSPDSWRAQDNFGNPQKLGPCGDEGGAAPSGKVTAFSPGQTISITINEVIPHPGHYRVALAVNDRSELPAPPLVTPGGGDPCASAAIQDPPIFPVLADNILPHTQPFSEPQTFTVTLPTDVTCTKCTLQVLEFMSNHGAPCFYHHCADISIQGAPVATATITATPAPTPTPPPAAECLAVTQPRLTVGKLLTALGDETFRFHGALTLPTPVSPGLDPATAGARLLLDDAGGNLLDVIIPGGSGWTVNTKGTRWSYRNKSATPPGGIAMLVIRDRSAASPGLVRFAVRGKAAALAVTPANLPVTGRLILASPGNTCGHATFPSCTFNRTGSRLRCK